VGASNGPRSCFVATSRWVTLFSICESCCCGCITGCVSAGNGHRKDAGGLRTGAHILWGAPVRPLRGANRGGGVLLGHGGRVQARYKMVNGCSARGDGDDMLSAMLVLSCSGRHLISTPTLGTVVTWRSPTSDSGPWSGFGISPSCSGRFTTMQREDSAVWTTEAKIAVVVTLTQRSRYIAVICWSSTRRRRRPWTLWRLQRYDAEARIWND
jgi:hypothetical protein